MGLGRVVLLWVVAQAGGTELSTNQRLRNYLEHHILNGNLGFLIDDEHGKTHDSVASGRSVPGIAGVATVGSEHATTKDFSPTHRISAHVATFLHTVALEVSAKADVSVGVGAEARSQTRDGVHLAVGAKSRAGLGAGSGGEFVPMDPECRRILNTFFLKCAFGPPVETELDH